MRYIVAFIVIFLASIPMEAAACSCAPPGTVQNELDKSTYVFLGSVTSIERRTPQMDKGWVTLAVEWIKQLFGADPPFTNRDFPYKLVSFSVTETFKGSSVRRVDLVTGMGGGDCGYFFEPGKEYVVYAYGNEDDLGTGICSLTGLSSDPNTGLPVLRDGS